MASQKHHGGCHCGAVEYTVELDLEADALVCNCSICRRTGAMMMFVAPDKFELAKGDDAVKDYTFNKGNIHHLFCTTCGVRSFGRGQGQNGPMVMVNARCLDDVNVFAQKTKQYDGASR
ncbi:GFA family protein [soil metagenome]